MAPREKFIVRKAEHHRLANLIREHRERVSVPLDAGSGIAYFGYALGAAWVAPGRAKPLPAAPVGRTLGAVTIDVSTPRASSPPAAPRDAMPDVVHALGALYRFTDEARVAEFLLTHTHLVSLLITARPRLAAAFPDAAVRLYVDRDGVLVALAMLPPGDLGLEQLAQFDRAWWYEVMPSACGDLVFDVENSA